MSEVTSGKLCRKCGIRVDPDGLCYCVDVLMRRIEQLEKERDHLKLQLKAAKSLRWLNDEQ